MTQQALTVCVGQDSREAQQDRPPGRGFLVCHIRSAALHVSALLLHAPSTLDPSP